jgi:hypothetical protein
MRAEQFIIVLRRCIAVFIAALAASAIIPRLDDAAANFERTDIGRYLSRMVSVPLALAAPPAAAGVDSQPMRADIQALVDEHMALQDHGRLRFAPLSCP